MPDDRAHTLTEATVQLGALADSLGISRSNLAILVAPRDYILAMSLAVEHEKATLRDEVLYLNGIRMIVKGSAPPLKAGRSE